LLGVRLGRPRTLPIRSAGERDGRERSGAFFAGVGSVLEPLPPGPPTFSSFFFLTVTRRLAARVGGGISGHDAIAREVERVVVRRQHLRSGRRIARRRLQIFVRIVLDRFVGDDFFRLLVFFGPSTGGGGAVSFTVLISMLCAMRFSICIPVRPAQLMSSGSISAARTPAAP